MNINNVQIAGKVTASPEKKSMPNGSSVCNFSLAVNRKYKKESGELTEEVEFINCVAFGKTADTFHQYVIKGQTMYVEGRLKTQTWEDKNGGGKRYKTEVVISSFEFGQKPLGAENRQEAKPEAKPLVGKGMETDNFSYGEVNYDDIPFN